MLISFEWGFGVLGFWGFGADAQSPDVIKATIELQPTGSLVVA